MIGTRIPEVTDQCNLACPAFPATGQQEALHAAIQAAMAVSTSKDDGSTKIVCISNLLSDAEMADQQESQDVLEDTKDKCEEDFGPVASAILVLPSDGDLQGWTGRLLVHFNDMEHAKKAAEKLHGLKFDGRPVACSFVDEKVLFSSLPSLPPSSPLLAFLPEFTLSIHSLFSCLHCFWTDGFASVLPSPDSLSSFRFTLCYARAQTFNDLKCKVKLLV